MSTALVVWQLVLVDMLFLCLAVGMGLWFRAWLQREKVEMDQRLQLLQAQQAHLDRISGRLQAVCRSLELMGRDAEGAKTHVARETSVELTPENEDVYGRAWDLLAQGKQPAEVARALGMGVAEVELMGRMLRHRRQG